MSRTCYINSSTFSAVRMQTSPSPSYGTRPSGTQYVARAYAYLGLKGIHTTVLINQSPPLKLTGTGATHLAPLVQHRRLPLHQAHVAGASVALGPHPSLFKRVQTRRHVLVLTAQPPVAVAQRRQCALVSQQVTLRLQQLLASHRSASRVLLAAPLSQLGRPEDPSRTQRGGVGGNEGKKAIATSPPNNLAAGASRPVFSLSTSHSMLQVRKAKPGTPSQEGCGSYD